MTSLTVFALMGCLLFAAPGSAGESSQVRDLVARADTLMLLGVVDKGATRSFADAKVLLDDAEHRLAGAGLSQPAKAELTLEIESVRQDLDLLLELYDERFYGVFPLARLTVPTLMADEGFVVTEQVFHAPDVAAVIAATRRLADLLDDYDHPHIVFRSSPPARRLELVASEELVRDGRSTPHNRRELLAALTAEELAMFDRGELEPELIDRLATALDTVSLLVLTIGHPVDLVDAHARPIHGDYFQPGGVIQGSTVDATLSVRVESFDFMGSSRDRREQHRPILMTQVLLFAMALLWASQVNWTVDRHLKLFYRLVTGAGLFLFGRIFTVAVTLVLRKYIPDARALAVAAWWWPALLGLLVILGGGVTAWLAQARLTNIVPGARGARAVGSIFGLVALGASSHFVAPTLLLDETAGFASFVPFLIATISLALLFAFAARTGPPVPHYFTIGPLILAPMVGVTLMTASPRLLWLAAASSGALCVAAGIRHRVAVARGTEEPEPTAEEAARADQEKLARIDKKIGGKLP